MSLSDLSLQELNNLCFEEYEEYEVIGQEPWEDGGKFQSRLVVFKEVATDKTYGIYQYRSGDHWQGYEHEVLEPPFEIEQRERIIKEWVPVGQP